MSSVDHRLHSHRHSLGAGTRWSTEFIHKDVLQSSMSFIFNFPDLTLYNKKATLRRLSADIRGVGNPTLTNI